MRGRRELIEIGRQAFVARPRADLRQVHGHATIQHVQTVQLFR